jgi:CMP-N-acetylneuraminic acid synthetase
VPYNEREDPAAWDPAYIYNASIYAMKRDFFLRENTFVSQRSVPLVTDRFHSADIDEKIDALVVELYFDVLGLDPFGDRKDATARAS